MGYWKVSLATFLAASSLFSALVAERSEHALDAHKADASKANEEAQEAPEAHKTEAMKAMKAMKGKRDDSDSDDEEGSEDDEEEEESGEDESDSEEVESQGESTIINQSTNPSTNTKCCCMYLWRGDMFKGERKKKCDAVDTLRTATDGSYWYACKRVPVVSILHGTELAKLTDELGRQDAADACWKLTGMENSYHMDKGAYWSFDLHSKTCAHEKKDGGHLDDELPISENNWEDLPKAPEADWGDRDDGEPSGYFRVVNGVKEWDRD